MPLRESVQSADLDTLNGLPMKRKIKGTTMSGWLREQIYFQGGGRMCEMLKAEKEAEK
jgi:hypothetical protein